VKANHLIIVVHITDRLRHAELVQRCLTQYGRHIRTRLGLHEVDRKRSSPNGLLILETVGDAKQVAALKRELGRIEGVEVKSVEFTHR
jgi:hypothetical protein